MFYHCLRGEHEERDDDEDDDEDDHEEGEYLGRSNYRESVQDINHCDVIVLKTDNGWCFDQDIFLPAWKRDAYEAAGQVDEPNGFGLPELVRVEEIRVD